MKYIRFNNGESVVAMVEEYGEIVKLCKPLAVFSQPSFESTKSLLMMTTWLPATVCKQHDIEIQKKDILFMTDVQDKIDDFIKGYAEQLYSTEVVDVSVSKNAAGDPVEDHDAEMSDEQANDSQNKVVDILSRFTKNKGDKPN